MSTSTLEIDSLKARLKETWMAGDYDRFSRYMEQGARIFSEQLDVPAACNLLDVACGSGQVALGAARDGANVPGVDIAPNLVQRAQARASAEGLNARFVEGDAEALPFEDADFHVIASLVGAMFALADADARRLRSELETLWTAHNRGGDDLTVVSSEYLEVIAVRA